MRRIPPLLKPPYPAVIVAVKAMEREACLQDHVLEAARRLAAVERQLDETITARQQAILLVREENNR